MSWPQTLILYGFPIAVAFAAVVSGSIFRAHHRRLIDDKRRELSRREAPHPAEQPTHPVEQPTKVFFGGDVGAAQGTMAWLSSRVFADWAGPIDKKGKGPAQVTVIDVNSLDTLDALAASIAQMIDDDDLAAMWARHKKGERNVFTRKLYTMRGQQEFEEIRRKYRADREFMRSVDRYIAEFERLLEEVSRDDRGQVMARTYLTSEPGLVFTMLSHAAGRFD